MTIAFVFPGQGSQAVGMGAELAKAHPAARAVFEEVDAALGQKLSEIMFTGPAGDADADRERTAGPDGSIDGRDACAGGRARLRACTARSSLWRATRSVSIRHLPPPALSRSPTRLAFSRPAARPCRKPSPSVTARWRRLLGVGKDVAEKLAARSGAGRGLPARQRQRTHSGRHLGQQERHRPRRAAGQGAWRAPLHAAQRQRAVSLCADATSSRRDGGSSGARGDEGACGPADCQRAGGPDLGSGRDQAAPRRAGDRHGALARKHRGHG